MNCAACNLEKELEISGFQEDSDLLHGCLLRKTAFDRVWAIKEAEGYQYGEDALEQVRFGWDLYHEYGVLWPYDDAPFTATQVRELLEENALLRSQLAR